MDKRKIIRAVVFFIIGVGLMWWVFKGTDLGMLNSELDRINWYWVGLSLVFNLLSQFVRAIRWAMLFKPLKYSPRTSNLFLSVIILAFTNQIIPRGGEIARLGVVNRYEKVPFAKLFGTALIERLTDLAILLSIFIALVIWQFPLIMDIVELPQISLENWSLARILSFIGLFVAVVVIAFFALKKFGAFNRLKGKMQKIKSDIKEGFTSIKYIKNKARFFTLSFLIYFLWLCMLFVLFYAYPPTSGLGFKAAAFTFGLATMAFLLPIQSGMGAWHFLAIQSLILFGIDQEAGKVFALMAHAATNLVHVPFGAIAFVLLPVINKSNGSNKK